MSMLELKGIEEEYSNILITRITDFFDCAEAVELLRQNIEIDRHRAASAEISSCSSISRWLL